MQRLGGLALAACLLTACASKQEEVVYRARPAAPERRLDANEITGVLHTNNLLEIEAGKLALERSRNERVRQFAQRMITQHSSADQQLLHIHRATENSAYAGELQRNGQQTIQTLRSYSGPAFDRAYIDNQVTMHQWLLTNLDKAFIPGTSGTLHAGLKQGRSMVAQHLEMAREIRSSLGNH